VSGQTVVLFGGTFDPPHLGHLLMATLAHEQYDAPVWLSPAPLPPHKLELSPLPFSWRLEMLRELVKGQVGLEVQALEAQLPSPSYTVDTLRYCHEQFSQYRFLFLMGADSLHTLPSWKGAEEMAEQTEFIVAARSGYPFEQTVKQCREELPQVRVKLLEMPLLDISSSWIRDRLSRGQSLCGLVPPAVEKLLRQAVQANS
jgi:nicotinate-nucleotide adenylyltransferase